MASGWCGRSGCFRHVAAFFERRGSRARPDVFLSAVAVTGTRQGVGRFDGRYNIRLHLTASRGSGSYAVRGESPVIEYTAGIRAHTGNVSSPGMWGQSRHHVRAQFATACADARRRR